MVMVDGELEAVLDAGDVVVEPVVAGPYHHHEQEHLLASNQGRP